MLRVSKIQNPDIIIYISLKENGLSPIFLHLLHLVGEGALAVVDLINLVVPVVQESVLNLTGGEAIRQIILASREDVLHSQSGVRDSGEDEGLRLLVGIHLRGSLRRGLLIFRANVLNHDGQVDGVVILHEVVVQSGDGVLLQSSYPFWFLRVSFSFCIFIIACCAYNVKLILCEVEIVLGFSFLALNCIYYSRIRMKCQ